jgi:hypothetical protein
MCFLRIVEVYSGDIAFSSVHKGFLIIDCRLYIGTCLFVRREESTRLLRWFALYSWKKRKRNSPLTVNNIGFARFSNTSDKYVFYRYSVRRYTRMSVVIIIKVMTVITARSSSVVESIWLLSLERLTTYTYTLGSNSS